MRMHPILRAVAVLCGGLLAIFGSCKKHAHDSNAHMNQHSFEELVARFEDPARAEWQKPDLVVSRLGDLRGKTVADLGAGTGYFSFRLAKAGARVIALDPDQRFLDYIEEQKKSQPQLDVEVRKTPENRMALADGEVDLILLVNVYHHIHDRIAYFGDARVALKPGGRIVSVDFRNEDSPVGPPPEHRIAPELAAEELRQAGYSVSIDANLLPYQYVLTARPQADR